MPSNEVIQLLAGGAVGAFCHALLVGGRLRIPNIQEGQLDLGFLGAIFLGMTAGFLVDHSFITALMAGYSADSVIKALVFTPPPINLKNNDQLQVPTRTTLS